METRVQKWGNSLALRIPKPFADELGLTQRTEVDVSVRDGKLVAVPVRRAGPRLADLLARVTRANRHSEAAFGPRAGREAW
ncbi:MAG: multidrug transporter MatE [Actinobacteria bacterium RBG_16_67_10]|nr:MAG: multidrug transporter MatE [Actinobacteria bacterium RBG_16_67_10]OGU00353.1 MAG: multidrug transporter MatE [Gemmatimonadetes bacterium GWC2_71_10]